MVKATEREYRRFIYERGLAGSFRSYRRLKSRPKKTIVVYQDGTRRQVYVLKENGKTVFRDRMTMRVLARSKKTIPKAITSVFTKKIVRGEFKHRGWNVSKEIKRTEITLNDQIDRYYLKSGIERRHRVSSRPPRKVGFVLIDATYISASGYKKRIQIRSPLGDLGDKNTRLRLLKEAVSNGSGLAGFSPVDVILNDVRYEWIRDIRVKV